MLAKRIFLSVVSAIALWFHTIPILGTTTESWVSLGVIAIFIFIVTDVSDNASVAGFAILGISILIGLGFLGYDLYHFLKDGIWNPTTLYSLFRSHIAYDKLHDWRGLVVISTWIWEASIWWWSLCIGCPIGIVWLGTGISEE